MKECKKIKCIDVAAVYKQAKWLTEDKNYTGELLFYYTCPKCKCFHLTRSKSNFKIDFIKLLYPNLPDVAVIPEPSD